MSNLAALKTAIQHLIEANNRDGRDHGKLIDEILDTALQGEKDNGNDVAAFPPPAFVEFFVHAANGQQTGEIACDTDYYLPLIVYALHKSNALLDSQCYFYGEFVSIYLPNLGIGLYIDDEARFFEVNDTLIVVEDKNGEMIDEGCYSENAAE